MVYLRVIVVAFIAILHSIMLYSTALLAMKGLMLQEDLTIEEALKVMEVGQLQPDTAAPSLPAKVLGKFLANYLGGGGGGGGGGVNN